MDLPSEVPVMTLPNATLFPQALLPLHIFEPQYRRMLKDVLHTDRMFAVAMQKENSKRTSPEPVAGLGVVRVAVDHPDGTSHLILQGLVRVELVKAVHYRPYRRYAILPLPIEPHNSAAVSTLSRELRELVRTRFSLGLPYPFPLVEKALKDKLSPEGLEEVFSSDKILEFLDKVQEPTQLADMVACALITRSSERQIILETLSLEDRLRLLILFLRQEIQRQSGPSLA